ncbi:hypothetical protein EGY20_07210 [Burkholderia multivorans]|nr:hypothetical protein EGY20_07210 [Burkholderia multivorans]
MACRRRERAVDCAFFVAQDAYAWPASQQYAVIASITPITPITPIPSIRETHRCAPHPFT